MKFMKSAVNKLRNPAALIAGVSVALGSTAASAQGLSKAKTVLEQFQTELTTIIPIAAAVILLGLAIGYAGKFLEKDTFVRWAIGVIIGGSAVQITALFFS